jgi:DNA-binding MarR family transcriptional regulator
MDDALRADWLARAARLREAVIAVAALEPIYYGFIIGTFSTSMDFDFEAFVRWRHELAPRWLLDWLDVDGDRVRESAREILDHARRLDKVGEWGEVIAAGSPKRWDDLEGERVEEALATADLPPLSWYDALWPLYRAPGRKLRVGELSTQVVTISRSGLTRLIDRLETAGLVRREPTAADRRGIIVAITSEGSGLLRRMWPVYAAVIQRSFVDALQEHEAVALAEALARVRAAGQDADAAATAVPGA